jgi:lipid A ethanolaminephosphotransferase
LNTNFEVGTRTWRTIPAVVAPLLVALFIVAFDNFALWRTLLASYSQSTPLFTLAAAVVMLTALFAALLQAINFPWIFKPIAVALLLLAAVTGYFMNSYGVIIDDAMIRNAAQTDAREAGELLTWRLFAHLLVFGIAPATVLVLLRLRYRPWLTEMWQRPLIVTGWLVLALLAAASAYKELSLTMRQHRELRMLINPSYPLYAFVEYQRQRTLAAPGPLRVVAGDAIRASTGANRRPMLLVLVLGETARAMQFSLNGYARDTNPELRALGVVSFTNVSSCGTSTAESVPCMFSHLAREAYSPESARLYENLLDIIRRTGVSVYWRDNNAGCKGICDRVLNDRPDAQPVAGLCHDDECFDELLLQGLPDYLSKQHEDVLIVLHQLGSHGPAYYKRVPSAFKKFQPECAQENVKECPRDSIINAYDNTILYTDHFLAETIRLLTGQQSRFDTALLYVSDHGESLGELGIYLHGFPYRIAPREQTAVPMIFWGSPGFLLRQRASGACLLAQRDRPLSHDYLFHSVLGMYGVRTSAYVADLDLLQSCRS